MDIHMCIGICTCVNDIHNNNNNNNNDDRYMHGVTTSLVGSDSYLGYAQSGTCAAIFPPNIPMNDSIDNYCIYIYIYIYTHTHTYTYMCICVYIYIL